MNKEIVGNPIHFKINIINFFVLQASFKFKVKYQSKICSSLAGDLTFPSALILLDVSSKGSLLIVQSPTADNGLTINVEFYCIVQVVSRTFTIPLILATMPHIELACHNIIKNVPITSMCNNCRYIADR
jgi:hypothetical protein